MTQIQDEIIGLNPDVIHMQVDDDIMLLKPDNMRRFSLKGVAATIWRRLESQHMTIKMITEYIDEQYTVDKSRSTQEVNQFIQTMLDEKMLIKVLDEH